MLKALFEAAVKESASHFELLETFSKLQAQLKNASHIKVDKTELLEKVRTMVRSRKKELEIIFKHCFDSYINSYQNYHLRLKVYRK